MITISYIYINISPTWDYNISKRITDVFIYLFKFGTYSPSSSQVNGIAVALSRIKYILTKILNRTNGELSKNEFECYDDSSTVLHSSTNEYHDE